MSTESSSPVHRSTLSLLSVTTAAVFALAACAPDDTITSEDDPDQVEDTPDPGADEETDEPAEEEQTDDEPADEEDAPEAGGEHSVYQALETVLEEYPGGVITAFEDEGGYIEVFVYDGSTEWELEVDSETFEIIDTEDDGIDSDDEAEAQAVEIDIAEALQTAEAESGAEPKDAELDTEDGTVVWQFEMTNDIEVYVDVSNGEVVKVDQ